MSLNILVFLGSSRESTPPYPSRLGARVAKALLTHINKGDSTVTLVDPLEFEFDKEGLFVNLLGFNLGVEIGQFLALGFVLLLIAIWRRYDSYLKFSKITNTLLMAAGFLLLGFQLTGYFTS